MNSRSGAGQSGPHHQLQPWLLLPSFRYGWAFYAAMGGFVGSELAAALYILLHTRLFRWKKIQSDGVSQRRTSNDPPCKEVAVQTSPLSVGGGILVDELSRRAVDQQNSAILHQVCSSFFIHYSVKSLKSPKIFF